MRVCVKERRERHIDKQTSETDRQTEKYRQADRQTDKQTDRRIGRHKYLYFTGTFETVNVNFALQLQPVFFVL